MSAQQKDNRHQKFEKLTEPYRHELRVHCYRLLGSLQDAEDLVQETYLRAWRKYIDNLPVKSYRPWLYKIATNACLDLLRQRKRRYLIQPDIGMGDPIPENLTLDGSIWLEPFPNKLLPNATTNPEATIILNESISLAFMTALQKLTPQHRAVLILRDVLGWKAKEVAEHLDMSLSAVNSATLRARQGLKKQSPDSSFDSEIKHHFLDQYVTAWENRDVSSLVSLLKADVVMSMPPMPLWLSGRENVATFLQQLPLNPVGGHWQLFPYGINGQPGFAAYQQHPASTDYHFMGILALTIEPDGIARIDHFLAGPVPNLPTPIEPTWFSFFGLEKTLD